MSRTAPMHGPGRALLAIVLAYALALQMLLAGMASGAHARPAGFAEQGPLCSPGGEPSPDLPTRAAHDGLCCILHTAPPLGSPPAEPTVLGRAPTQAAVSYATWDGPLGLRSLRRPFEARAPPALG